MTDVLVIIFLLSFLEFINCYSPVWRWPVSQVYCCQQMRDVNNKKLEMGNEEEKRENEKWEQNLTWTLTLSVSWFPILCFVPIFHFFSFPARFSNICRWAYVSGLRTKLVPKALFLINRNLRRKKTWKKK